MSTQTQNTVIPIIHIKSMDQNLYNTIAEALQDAYEGQHLQLNDTTTLTVESIDKSTMEVLVNRYALTGELVFSRTFGFLM